MHTHARTYVQIIQKRETAAKPPTHYRSASLTFRADSLSPTSTLERGKKVESGMGLELDDDLFPVPRMITISGESVCMAIMCGSDDLYPMRRPLPNQNSNATHTAYCIYSVPVATIVLFYIFQS